MDKIDLKKSISPGETVYWQGKPDRKVFILHSVFNALLPIAAIWCIIDFTILSSTFREEIDFLWFLVPFFAIHLMPVWIYLAGVIFSLRRFRNTKYLITDQAIYISGGVFSVNIEIKPLAQLSNISIRRGILDRRFGVGSIVLDNGESSRRNNLPGVNHSFQITYIHDSERIFKMIKEIQENTFSDAMFPNELRPAHKTKSD